MSILIFDTETTGFIQRDKEPSHPDQPDLVQLAALLFDDTGHEVAALSTLVRPDRKITDGAFKAHGISQAKASQLGVGAKEALTVFEGLLNNASVIVAHNLEFDAKVMLTAWHRAFQKDFRDSLVGKRAFCTMKAMTPVCKIMHKNPRHRADFKWPKLSECIHFLFGEKLEGAHDALVDARACARVYFEMQARKTKKELQTQDTEKQVLLPETTS